MSFLCIHSAINMSVMWRSTNVECLCEWKTIITCISPSNKSCLHSPHYIKFKNIEQKGVRYTFLFIKCKCVKTYVNSILR